ncbi:PAP2 superfamily-domain-containing protein [Gymnopilus junonius]|uniref:PAP2 superfamily-domain-containing protein n=1 Tax=Gymnopilus junonius TaxID=109634 RepID=A0A9P5NDV9_GYMJU|nr:PAP2 superfamily-domain-containing protein [Gymnopilus junonius]
MVSKKSARFTLSLPPSEASSRSSSPAPSDRVTLQPPPNYIDSTHDYINTKLNQSLLEDDEKHGRQGRDVYESTLSWWRAGLRRKLVTTVQWESQVIAKMQDKIRTPWLDAYFVYTSTLGTHTFFMIILPALFFFGYDELGRGLVIVIGMGIYLSSVVKDLFCSPRPLAPPVTRLTIGSHHLEYGFPSTHSTNSVSIALFFFAEVHRLANTPMTIPNNLTPSLNTNDTFTTLANSTISVIDNLLTTEDAVTQYMLSQPLYILMNVILLLYAFSIVFGRLYTAMHSFTDCLIGVTLGAAIWWAHTSWAGMPIVLSTTNPLYYAFSFLGLGTPVPPGELLIYFGKGLGTGKLVDIWLERGGWEVPLILIPLTLLAVHYHPQPVDDCPCFEDAIAILSVVLGALVSRWGMVYSQADSGLSREVVMPGSGWVFDLGSWVQVERRLEDELLWWSMAAVKMITGIVVIFVWRLIAKSALHLILPPTFRLLARAFRLPRRRFYTPATEYKSVPSEFHSTSEGGGFELHPIPSVIDLPSAGIVGFEVGGIGSGVVGSSFHQGNGNGNSNSSSNGSIYGSHIKMRSGNGVGNSDDNEDQDGHDWEKKNGIVSGPSDKEKTGKDGDLGGVAHYDADVLTKVIVYAGIAVLAAEVLPLMFDLLGWG